MLLITLKVEFVDQSSKFSVCLTVPHLINPIFQYIFDCLGKRSIRPISKIIAFGAQKIQTSWLRSRCIHNDWLFGADFGTVASLGHFFRKWPRNRRYGQWLAFPCHAQRIFVSKNWRGWHGRHLISIGRGHLPHIQRNNRSLAHRFRKSNNQPKFWCHLAASELWFNPVRLFSCGEPFRISITLTIQRRLRVLKHEIEVAIHGVEAQTIENVLENCVDRMGYCKVSRGRHLNVVFHS